MVRAGLAGRVLEKVAHGSLFGFQILARSHIPQRAHGEPKEPITCGPDGPAIETSLRQPYYVNESLTIHTDLLLIFIDRSDIDTRHREVAVGQGDSGPKDDAMIDVV